MKGKRKNQVIQVKNTEHNLLYKIVLKYIVGPLEIVQTFLSGEKTIDPIGPKISQ